MTRNNIPLKLSTVLSISISVAPIDSSMTYFLIYPANNPLMFNQLVSAEKEKTEK